jgi:hypothetical protein
MIIVDFIHDFVLIPLKAKIIDECCGGILMQLFIQVNSTNSLCSLSSLTLNSILMIEISFNRQIMRWTGPNDFKPFRLK